MKAQPKTEIELSWEKGLTAEWLVESLEKIKKDLRGFVFKKLYSQDQDRREWVNRYYGGYSEFYKEVYQELTLYALERLDKIPQNCTYKHLFWYLRTVMGRCLYRVNPELYINESFNDLIPDESLAPSELKEKEAGEEKFRTDLDRADLTKNERSILKYRYFQEMNYDEICQQLNIGYTSATNSHENALRKLRMHFILNQNVK